MTRHDDYFDAMGNAGLTDSDIDVLIEGGSVDDGTRDLERFIASMRSDSLPPRDVDFMATSLAATARSSRPTSARGAFRRLVVAAMVGAMLIAMAGVAMAADGAAPGDFLYGLDRTLEDLGVGDGGIEERIAEFEKLLLTGDDETAYTALTQVIEESDDVEAAIAERHIEFAASMDNPTAASTQQKVADIKKFIEENKGKGVGLDGADFGQGVAEIAKSNNSNAQNENSSASNSTQGPPDHAASTTDNEKETGPPDHAGPKDDQEVVDSSDSGAVDGTSDGQGEDTSSDQVDETKETGPPDHAGPKEDKSNGNSQNAGPKEKSNGTSENAGSKKDE